MPALIAPSRKIAWYAACVVLVFTWVWFQSGSFAQELDDPVGPTAPSVDAPANGTPATSTDSEGIGVTQRRTGLNLWSLLRSGGVFMVPIVLLSVLVVTVAVERFIGMRRARILPGALIRDLGQLGGARGNFDPREAYRICQRHPSAAANVIRAMLLKVGRPHSEVEHTVQEASQREADRLYRNVRWLNLAAGVAPLLGLLGTVWGMIRAFHDTTQLAPGQNKADQLAEGIYVALVTTLCGLVVAIPAAILSHYFEGRVQTLFHQIDELLFNLLPQVERYEGRVRFSQPAGDGDTARAASGNSDSRVPAAEPAPASSK